MLDAARAGYVIQYYRHLMTPQEWRADGHLRATTKLRYGRILKAAQLEAGSSPHTICEHLSTDPEVLKLVREGHAFTMRTAQRILDEHRDEIAFNYCPRCGALARTPKARQCRFCRHDWHSAA